MATAVLSSVPSTLDLAESTASWNGDTFSLEPDIKKQGSNSISCTMTNNGNNDVFVNGFTAADLSAEHIRLWFNISFVGNLVATDAIQVFISDGTNTAYWSAGLSDYAGGWAQAVIYTGNTPLSGTKPTGNSTQVGMRFVCGSKPRNVPANAWFDAWYYGDGYTVTGGTSGDEISWEEISIADAAQAYGIVEKINGVYFLAGDIQIGDGVSTTYFKDEGQKAGFKDLSVSSTLYGISFFDDASNLTNVDINGGAYFADGAQRYLFDCSLSDINSLTLSGKQFSSAGEIFFAAGQTVTNCVFDNCQEIDPSSSSFTNNTISNYIGILGALAFPSSDTTVSGIRFINCDNAVMLLPTSDPTPIFTDFIFDDVSGKYDVNNLYGSAITVNISGTGNANSFNPGGDSVTFSNPKSFQFTVNPAITGYEWRLYYVTAVGSMAGAVEQDGEESASVSTQIFNYNYGGDQAIAIQIMAFSQDYEEILRYFTLKNSDQDITLDLIKDTNN